MQGLLRNEPLTFTIETHCGQTNRPLHIEIGSDLNFRVVESGADPHIFIPMVDFGRLEDPSIIDAF